MGLSLYFGFNFGLINNWFRTLFLFTFDSGSHHKDGCSHRCKHDEKPKKWSNGIRMLLEDNFIVKVPKSYAVLRLSILSILRLQYYSQKQNGLTFWNIWVAPYDSVGRRTIREGLSIHKTLWKVFFLLFDFLKTKKFILGKL